MMFGPLNTRSCEHSRRNSMKVFDTECECVGFNPFNLTLRFESQSEARQFFNIFYYSPIIGSAPDVDSTGIRHAMATRYPDVCNTPSWQEFDSTVANKVKEYVK